MASDSGCRQLLFGVEQHEAANLENDDRESTCYFTGREVDSHGWWNMLFDSGDKDSVRHDLRHQLLAVYQDDAKLSRRIRTLCVFVPNAIARRIFLCNTSSH